MPPFHCPLGAICYEEGPCIRCGLCIAKSREQAIEASRILREFLKTHATGRQKKYLIRKIVVCGKGGVGKSTITTLMANSLVEYDYHVLVIDTDESNPGLYRMLGFSEQPTPLMKIIGRFSLGENAPDTQWLKQNKIALGDIPSSYLLSTGNLQFLMIGKIEDPFQGCACSMAEICRDLMIKLDLKDREIVLVDQEAGVESFGRGVERGADTVLVVVEPSFESVSLAERIRYMAEGIGINRVRAILNKVPTEEVASKIINELIKREVRYLGTVYNSFMVAEAGLEGLPLGECDAKEQVRRITQLMLDEAEMKYSVRDK